MHGAREALASGLTHVEKQVEAIEEAVFKNPAYAFELAKTLVESTCRTILRERNINYSEDDDLPRLFRTVKTHLPFLPPTASSEAAVRASLVRTLSGLGTAIQGICELRNQCNFAAHGADKQRPAMESVHSLLAAQAADTIVGFLYRVHKQERMAPASPRNLYDDNSAFNDSVDDLHDIIHIFDVELRPSEVLFHMEPESYRIYLTEFNTGSASTSTSASLEATS